MHPALVIQLERAVELGRALAARHEAVPPLPLLSELRRLDASLALVARVQDITWLDGQPHLVVGDVRILLNEDTITRLASTIAARAQHAAA